MAKFDVPPAQESYYSEVFHEELLFNSQDLIRDWAKNDLQMDLNWTKCLIKAYFFGSRFSHREAYILCGAGESWPDFARHPDCPQLIINFKHMHGYQGQILPQKFEEWVDIERKEISLRAAEALDIPWEEIENATME